MTRPLRVLLLTLVAISARADIGLDSVDGFAASTEGWVEGGASPNPPTWSGGPGWDGVTNGHLVNRSNGSGSGGKLQMWNNGSKWTGDYSAAGVHAISLQVDNRTGFGSDLPLRIAFQGPGGWFASTPQTVSDATASNEWRLLTFLLEAGSFAYVPGSGGNQDWVSTLSAVSTFQILVSSGMPRAKGGHLAGSEVVADLHFDDIRAEPAPPPPQVVIMDAEASGAAIVLRWRTDGGDLAYTVQSRADLTAGDWTPAPPTSQWPIATTAWTNAEALQAAAFYRITATPRQ
jgi:hypothetical protein